MRLIDADALKKEWRMGDKCDDCPQNTRRCQYDVDFSRMDICQMIDDAPTAVGWISVKDRLPEQVGYKCIVAAKFIDGKYVRFTAFTGYGEPGWWTYETVYMEKAPNNKVHHNFTVTHWMPLPEPPEE